ncbi:MAG: hypothetical protein ACMG6E_01900, partial [Candidatus Roizmanbacteria bacterium]
EAGIAVLEQLPKLMDFHKLHKMTSFLTSVPQVFMNWLYDINNIHIGINTELLIHIANAKKARDVGQFYYGGISYDIFKLRAYLLNQSLLPEVIETSVLTRSENLTTQIRYSLHLWGDTKDSPTGKLHRILDLKTDERQPWSQRRGILAAGDHHGQRKLLLSEIDFITSNARKNEPTIIIYIGAAPCDHGTLLLRMFPYVNLWIIDPRCVADDIREYGPEARVMITTGIYNQEMADMIVTALKAKDQHISESSPKLAEMTEFTERYDDFLFKNEKKGYRRLLFISDIRSKDQTSSDEGKLSREVEKDNQTQIIGLDELATLAPKGRFMASLKFKVPWIGKEDTYRYRAGEIHTQPWARLNSPECRLWTGPNAGFTNYDRKTYDEIMVYHNVQIRSQNFGSKGSFDGYGFCHDCHYEIEILTEYIKKFSQTSSMSVEAQLSELTRKFTAKFGSSLFEHANMTERAGRRLRNFGGDNPIMSPSKAIKRAVLVEQLETDFTKHFNKILTGVTLPRGVSKPTEVDVRKLFKHFSYVITALKGIINLNEIFEISGMPILQRLISDEFNIIMTGEQVTQLMNAYNAKIGKTTQRVMSKLDYEGPTQVITTKAEDSNKLYRLQATFQKHNESTLKFSRSFLSRILAGDERAFTFKFKQLLKEPLIIDRTYFILQRYKDSWIRTLAQSPRFFYNSHPMLPGLECGATILSAHKFEKPVKHFPINEQYCAVYEDFELLYTNRGNLMKLADEDILLHEKVVSIFPPNLPVLVDAYAKKWEGIITANSDHDLAIVFIIPEGDEAKFLRASAFFSKEMDFDGKVWNYMLDVEEKLGTARKILILKTSKSTFDL